jgi:hypothetical protein
VRGGELTYSGGFALSETVACLRMWRIVDLLFRQVAV